MPALIVGDGAGAQIALAFSRPEAVEVALRGQGLRQVDIGKMASELAKVPTVV